MWYCSLAGEALHKSHSGSPLVKPDRKHRSNNNMPSTNDGDTRQNVSLGGPIKRAIDLIAEHEDRSRAVVIGRAIRSYVDTNPELLNQLPSLQLTLDQ